MKSCHERIEGTCDVWSSKWILCCCIHMIVCSGVLNAEETGIGWLGHVARSSLVNAYSCVFVLCNAVWWPCTALWWTCVGAHCIGNRGRTIITLLESASAVSTCLTIVDNSCVMKSSGGDTCGLGDYHTDIEGQPCTGKDDLVDNTLQVGCHYRIALWFMGTVEESLMTR